MRCIQIGSGHLYYSKHAGGNKILLAFHGFGQDNEIFSDWIEVLDKEYTVYAFDLFHHGKSIRDNKKLTKNEWTHYIQTFITQENIQEFSLVGFSLGGRFAISTALAYPKHTKELILIAPDGIFLSLWFRLATNPVFKWVFRYFMFHPNRLDRLVTFNDKYGLVSPYLGDFVRKEMNTIESRKRVYLSWNHFKSLGYSKKQLSMLFNRHAFGRRIILGSKDHIIHPTQILPLIEKMGDFSVDILPMKHHQLIKTEVAKLIANK
ncbi:MAG: alpha/beta hydrolase [Ekhidna sp.]